MRIAYTIELNDEKEVEELEKIAEERGWHVMPRIVTPYKPANISDENLRKLHELMEKGIDVSNYGDPVEWQRRQREDRKLPFRD